MKGEKYDNCEPRDKISLMGGFIMEDRVIEFLCRAKKATYASGNRDEIISSRPNSHDLEYVENDLKYIDSYLGGEKFAGEESFSKIISLFGLWIMLDEFLKKDFLGHF